MRKGTAVFATSLAMLAWCSCHRNEGLSSTSDHPCVYVSDEDSNDVTVLDATTNAVLATIPVGKRPRGLRLSRDGKTLFVALSGSPKGGPGVDDSKLPPADRGADGIGVVDLATAKLVRTLASGQDPEAFDVSSDGAQLFVSNEETAQTSVVDVASGAVVATIPVGAEPEGVTTRPGGLEVYVTSEAGNSVTIVDAKKLTAIATVAAKGRPRSIAFTPDGARAFVTAENDGVVHVIDATNRAPVGDIEIEKPDGAVTAPRPMGTAVSRDGKTLYVTNGRAGTVSVIDVGARKVTQTIVDVGARPWGVGLAPDGRRLYVANGSSNDVAVIDAASGTVLKRVPVGRSPWGVAVTQ